MVIYGYGTNFSRCKARKIYKDNKEGVMEREFLAKKLETIKKNNKKEGEKITW